MTGTNKLALKHALNIVLASLADRGGQIVSVNVDGKPLDISPETMKLKIHYANMLLGTKLSSKELGKLLEKMGYGISKSDDNTIEVLVPCYRADILHPIDLVEDIAIAYGYENFGAERTNIITVGKSDMLEDDCYNIKLLMLGLGFQETAPFTLTNKEVLEASKVKEKAVGIKNPRTADFTVVRPSSIPSLLSTLAYNKKKKIPQRIFEIDDISDAKTHKNVRKLGMAILGREINFSEMQSAIEALLRNLGVEYKLKESARDTFIKGRCGEIVIGGKSAGIFGEVHPQVLEKFGLDYPAVLAEMDVEALL
jgi:phenylalanyl-tRNA synthetase beta chain